MEGYGPATYGDAFADVYDAWYGEVGDPDEIAQTLHELTGTGRALELGVGTGRLAEPLARRGTSVVGLDASSAMLVKARSRATFTVALADMAAPPFAARTFDTVFVAYNTFFNLPDAPAQQRCVRSVHRLLRPGGAFVIDAFVPPTGDDGRTSGVELRDLALDHVVLTASRLDPRDQTILGQHIEIRESGVRLRPWFLHYLTPPQLDELASDTGFELVQRWGGWSRQPFTDHSESHVSVYRAQ